jgi:squalene-hopene/tetraprenyl-beta-curcumene cyclase
VLHLIERQRADGTWRDPEFTTPIFPRVLYVKHHGYSRYLPLWALARYRRLAGA